MNGQHHDDTDFEKNVFINCPFDAEYLKLLRPLLFTIVYLGFNPRISSERLDSLENRLDKICELIKSSHLSIHDLSRLRAARTGDLYRMNMPFELGIEYGCRVFGDVPLTRKKCLILEKERYDFGRALSDLSGMDIDKHSNEPDEIVRAVRNWFVETAGVRGIIAPKKIWLLFNDFANDFYDARQEEGFTDEDLDMMPVPEYIDFIREWVSEIQD